MNRFFDHDPTQHVDYESLPALVRAGQNRDAEVKRIIDAWCSQYRVVHDPKANIYEAVDRHIAAVGLAVEGVSFWDETAPGETDGRPGAPIDLGDLLRQVEDRLHHDAPDQFKQRPDLYIPLKRCWVHQCNARGVRVRPRFVSLQVRFDQVDLSGARFGDSARFVFAKFGDSASFIHATFGDSASFWSAKFGDEAGFDKATFGDSANFGVATFGDSASFWSATFGHNARFADAKFGDEASFVLAKFGDSASFDSATFADAANFQYADLQKASMQHADLRGADLRNTRGLVLDVTRVRDAHFSPLSDDPWSTLRRAYTGPRLLFNLLLLIAFFLPYVARTGYWVAINRTQAATAELIHEARGRAEELRPEYPKIADAVEGLADSVERNLPGPDNPDSRRSQVWRVVIGVDRGTWFWVSAVLLLVYNALRAALTLLVAPMRDEEERSGVSPAYRVTGWSSRPREQAEREARGLARLRLRCSSLWWAATTRWTECYGWLSWPHRVVTVIFWLAVASFAWNAWHWLRLDVWLPPATNA